jgi:CheY-like chemotaxis protein
MLDMVMDGGLVEVATDPKKHGVGKTVLVVDDSEFLRKSIEHAFLSDGFKTCVEAENGQEAIEVAKKCQPDLIILDLSMPVMNGLEAAPILRRMFPKIPIFLFTLYADAVNKETLLPTFFQCSQRSKKRCWFLFTWAV